jgi:hypothetical protein
MHLWVVGGVQSREAGVSDRNHSVLYGLGRVGRLDTATGDWHNELDWRAPGGDAHALKGASPLGDGLLLSAHGVVFAWSAATGPGETWTHPALADTHHALVHDGAWWATSTGTDTVLRRRESDVDHWPMAPGARPDRIRRPTRAHPNHLFAWNGALWATRLHARDAVEVCGEGRVALGDERVHDGVVRDGLPWFTSVDGALVTPGHRLPLRAWEDRDAPLGWCRGLAFDGDVAWVGFSRLRATRWRGHLAWARGALRGRQQASAHPTRVSGYDLARGEKVAEYAVPLDAVFALVPCTRALLP